MKKIKTFVLVFLFLTFNRVFASSEIEFEIERIAYLPSADAAYNGDVCVAVGSKGQIIASNDFVNWEFCYVNDYNLYFSNVFWLGNEFIALSNPSYGDCKVYISNNGFDWEYKSTLDLPNDYKIYHCYVLDDNEIFLGLSDTTPEKQMGWLIRDYQIFSKNLVELSDYINFIRDFDTKGGVSFMTNPDRVKKMNGEEYLLPDSNIVVDSGVRYPEDKPGYITKIKDEEYYVNDNYYSSSFGIKKIYDKNAFELFTELYTDYVQYIKTESGYFVSASPYNYHFQLSYWHDTKWTKVYLYDFNLNLVSTYDFNQYVHSISYQDGFYSVVLGEAENTSGNWSSSFKTMISRDFENWEEDDFQKELKDYEKVYEVSGLNENGACHFMNMYFHFDAKNKDTYISNDGIYGTKTNIPYEFQEKRVIWEDENYFYLRDDTVQIKTKKETFYQELEKLKSLPYIMLNEKILVFEEPPVIEDDRMLVPMRFLFEQMGAEVEWDQATQTTTVLQENDAVAFQINNRSATVNSQAQTMDVPARLINGKTMIPIRFLSENLGYTVEWDEETNMAIITK